MAYDVASIFNSANSVDNLVYQFMLFEQEPRNRILDKQDVLNNKKSVLSDLDSKLSNLYSAADKLTDSVIDYFSVNTSSSSNSELFTTSATSSANPGVFSLDITRLASADTRVSRQYTSSNSDFTGFTSDQTISIELAHPTSSDEDNRETISVTISGSVFSQTNDQVMSDIKDAIDSAINAAVLAETIDSDEKITTSIVEESDGKTRLVVRSNQTGYTNRISFTDSSDSLLSTLGVLESSGAYDSSTHDYGYMTNIGTNDTNSGLNSIIEVDGLTFYRDSNQVSDAITGVTLNLDGITTTTETVTVETDVNTVKQDVQAFMDAYNSALDFLKQKSHINPDTLQHGELSDDYTYRALYSDLRTLALGSISDSTSNDYTNLYNLGIGFNNDGKMIFEDADDFTLALQTDTELVSDIFNNDDGIATVIQDKVNTFTKTGGFIDSSKEIIDSNLLFLKQSLNRVEDQLSAKEQRYRNEFARLQEMMASLNDQMSSLRMFSQGF